MWSNNSTNYQDPPIPKIGEAVHHIGYNPEFYYGLGLVQSVTRRDAFGRPSRVKVLWSKCKTNGDIDIRQLRLAHSENT